MRMRQETFKKSYYIPAFGKSIEIRRNQDIDEEGVLGKELLAQYGEDCILEGETKSLMEKVASGDIGTSLTTEQTAAIEKIERLVASAKEIDDSIMYSKYPFNEDSSITKESSDKLKNLIFAFKDFTLLGNYDKSKSYWLASFSRNSSSTNYRIDIHDSDNVKVCGGSSAFIVEENSEGVTTFILPAYNNSGITAEFKIDYSKITDGEIYYGAVDLTQERTTFSALSSFKVVEEHQKYNNRVKFNTTTNVIDVYSKYGESSDLRVTFDKFTDNQLFGLHKVAKKLNGNMNPVSFTIGTTICEQDTDWIGPYYVKATSNGDSGIKARTGGAHPNGTTPTAITDSVDLYIDGILYSATSGDMLCNKVDIYVNNRVMAYNTLTTSRYVLKEQHHYSIVGNEITVKVNILPLESITIEDYYGMQCYQGFYDTIHYIGGQYAGAVASLNTNTNSGVKSTYFCTKAIFKKTGTTEFMEIELDSSIGLGNREYLPLTSPMIISKDFEKSYMWQIYNNSIPFVPGGIKSWRGKYIIGKAI